MDLNLRATALPLLAAAVLVGCEQTDETMVTVVAVTGSRSAAKDFGAVGASVDRAIANSVSRSWGRIFA